MFRCLLGLSLGGLVASFSAASAPSAPSCHGVCLHRGAFTPAECDAIVTLMKKRPAERDVRTSESVSRVNYWDTSEEIRSTSSVRSVYDWIYNRVLEKARATSNDEAADDDAVEWGFDVAAADSASMSKQLDFVLLHEFLGTDFFDWHTDTKPGDGTGRTVNVNVMLSSSSSRNSDEKGAEGDYTGGGLLVGDCDVRPEKGDLYWYPAGYPHKVADVEAGVRHTLVLAIKVDEASRSKTRYWEKCEANFLKLTSSMAMQDAAKAAAAAAAAARRSRDGGGSGDEDDESKAVAAKAAPAATTAVGEGSVVGAFGGIKMAAAEWWRSSKPFRHGSQSKWHLLFGEHLAAQGRDSEADESFANSYAASEQAAEYALKFDEDGQRLVAEGRLKEALPFFVTAARIDAVNPTNPIFKAHVNAIEAALK